MNNLKNFKEITNDELLFVTGGYWKTIWSVGPGVYQRNTETNEYRWIQTQDNLSYTLNVVSNGWASSAAGGYFGKSR